jgi:hypothetical protein
MRRKKLQSASGLAQLAYEARDINRTGSVLAGPDLSDDIHSKTEEYLDAGGIEEIEFHIMRYAMIIEPRLLSPARSPGVATGENHRRTPSTHE